MSEIRRVGSPAYHGLLVTMGALLLGPLCALVAIYQNLKLGTFDAGNILAGSLASVIVVLYGRKAMHGANYVQTLAASMGTMAGVVSIIQAQYWLKMPIPNPWLLVLYVICVSNFGMGVGMMSTPLLVDQWKLPFPGAKAVADTLRILADGTLLKRSIAALGGAALFGFSVEQNYLGVLPTLPDKFAFSVSSLATGLIVSGRIAMPALVAAWLGQTFQPWMLAHGWLKEGDEPRAITFLTGLAAIFSASVLALLLDALPTALEKMRGQAGAEKADRRVENVPTGELLLWTIVWGAASVYLTSTIFHIPIIYPLVALVLSGFFVLSNGISSGISNANPISAAFVFTLMVLVAMGVTDAGVGLLCAGIVFMAVATGTDLQGDRSVGWRLGSSRRLQWRYHAIGTTIGSSVVVFLALLFLTGNPELQVDTPNSTWKSSMTFKIARALKGMGHYTPQQYHAIVLGLILGVVLFAIRRWGMRKEMEDGSKRFVRNGLVDWFVDGCVIPSPFALSFGLFLPFQACLWYAVGGVFTDLFLLGNRKKIESERSAWEATAHEDAEGVESHSETSGRPGLLGSGMLVGGAIAALITTVVKLLGH